MKIRLPKEFHPVFLYSNPNKPRWVFKLDRSNVHYTATIDEGKRHFNIHKTLERPGSPNKSYKHILTIRFFALARILVLFKRNFPNLSLKYYQQYRSIEHLAKNHDALLPMECNQSEFPDLVVKKKKNLKLAREFNLKGINEMFIYPEDIDQCKSETFMTLNFINDELITTGFLKRIQLEETDEILLFISLKNQQSLLHEYMKSFCEILDQVRFKGKAQFLKHMRESFIDLENFNSKNKAS